MVVEIRGNFGERYVGILGGYADIDEVEGIIEKIGEIDDGCETFSQVFDASKIAGKNHLLHSSKLALEALESDSSFADSPPIELTCWVAGRRQINKSLEQVGVKAGVGRPVALVTIGKESEDVEEAQDRIISSLDIEVDISVLEITGDKIDELKGAFSITQKQLKVSDIESLVLERVALLSLEQ